MQRHDAYGKEIYQYSTLLGIIGESKYASQAYCIYSVRYIRRIFSYCDVIVMTDSTPLSN